LYLPPDNLPALYYIKKARMTAGRSTFMKKTKNSYLISALQPVIKMKGWAELLEKIYR
jgi:hypothetical protein